MNADCLISLYGELELIHFRGGKVVGYRRSGPRTPAAAQRDFWLKHALVDPWAWAVNKLRKFTPLNVVTSAAATYIATDFASGQASPHIGAFNFHAFGTGKASGGTHTPGAATNATPIVVTDTAHGYTLNDLVTLSGYTGNTAANGDWEISPVTANTYTLLGSAGNGASGGSPLSNRLNGAGDTALVTDSGVARVTGTQSNPSGNVYKSVATMTFTSSLSISEWGIFSAASAGTMLDRRWLNTGQAPQVQATATLTAAPISVQNGDSIQATYQLTVNFGGS